MSATMQALVVLEPGRLEIREVPVPVPGPNEVLARVRAVSICGTDAHLIRGDYPGFWPPSFPFIPGHEWAGEIAELGPGVFGVEAAAQRYFDTHADGLSAPQAALLAAVSLYQGIASMAHGGPEDDAASAGLMLKRVGWQGLALLFILLALLVNLR